MWAMASVNYYLMSYYIIYLPGNTYTNTYAAGIAEIAAIFFGGVLIKVCSAKWAFVISNSIAFIGGLCILMLGAPFPHWMALFVIIAKFGVSSAYMLNYNVTIDVFPTLFAATAFGICNLIASFGTVITPYLAQMPEPYPMLVFCALTIIGVLISFFLIIPTKPSLNK